MKEYRTGLVPLILKEYPVVKRRGYVGSKIHYIDDLAWFKLAIPRISFDGECISFDGGDLVQEEYVITKDLRTAKSLRFGTLVNVKGTVNAKYVDLQGKVHAVLNNATLKEGKRMEEIVETLCEIHQPDGDCEKCPLWQEEKRKENESEKRESDNLY